MANTLSIGPEYKTRKDALHEKDDAHIDDKTTKEVWRRAAQNNEEMPIKRVNLANSPPFLYYKACFGRVKINKRKYRAKMKRAV